MAPRQHFIRRRKIPTLMAMKYSVGRVTMEPAYVTSSSSAGFRFRSSCAFGSQLNSDAEVRIDGLNLSLKTNLRSNRVTTSNRTGSGR